MVGWVFLRELSEFGNIRFVRIFIELFDKKNKDSI